MLGAARPKSSHRRAKGLLNASATPGSLAAAMAPAHDKQGRFETRVVRKKAMLEAFSVSTLHPVVNLLIFPAPQHLICLNLHLGSPYSAWPMVSHFSLVLLQIGQTKRKLKIEVVPLKQTLASHLAYGSTNIVIYTYLPKTAP